MVYTTAAGRSLGLRRISCLRINHKRSSMLYQALISHTSTKQAVRRRMSTYHMYVQQQETPGTYRVCGTIPTVPPAHSTMRRHAGLNSPVMHHSTAAARQPHGSVLINRVGVSILCKLLQCSYDTLQQLATCLRIHVDREEPVPHVSSFLIPHVSHQTAHSLVVADYVGAIAPWQRRQRHFRVAVVRHS